MIRLHCRTCTCADDEEPIIVDWSAPFYALVIEIDRLFLEEQRARYMKTTGRRIA